MIAKESKLKIVTSDIFESNIVFIPSELTLKEINDKMDKAIVDIDFDIKSDKSGDLFVFTSININDTEDPHPGYRIFVYGATLFSFSEDTNEEERKALIQSAVSISITNLRNFINNATSFYPLGSFSFHSIDMEALFIDKLKDRNKLTHENSDIESE